MFTAVLHPGVQTGQRPPIGADKAHGQPRRDTGPGDDGRQERVLDITVPGADGQTPLSEREPLSSRDAVFLNSAFRSVIDHPLPDPVPCRRRHLIGAKSTQPESERVRRFGQIRPRTTRNDLDLGGRSRSVTNRFGVTLDQ